MRRSTFNYIEDICGTIRITTSTSKSVKKRFAIHMLNLMRILVAVEV
ncbi:hypothetical protein [Latilactobacillus sakei]|nr:hypothetical protein [Latilactobacillus sakei]